MGSQFFSVHYISIINHLSVESNILSEEKTRTVVLSLVSFFIFICVFFLIFFFLSKKKIIQKELEKKELELLHQKQLLEENLLVQEKERQRIGGELHDDISSQLNLMAFDLNLLKQTLSKNPEEKEIYNHLFSLIVKANDNSRKIAHHLYPPLLEKFGLNAALDELISDYNFADQLNLSVVNTTTFNIIKKESQLHIYRIFQELINNSIKHGAAKNITISIIKLPTLISIKYTDDGIGFDMEKYALKKTGLGLKNIENRIFFLKATYNISAKEGTGFQFECSIPIDAEL